MLKGGFQEDNRQLEQLPCLQKINKRMGRPREAALRRPALCGDERELDLIWRSERRRSK